MSDLPSAQLILGGVLQSLALGIVAVGDVNTSFITRAVGTFLVTLLFILGSLLAIFARPFSVGLMLSASTVPIVRADIVMLLISRFCHVLLWATKLHTSKILYLNEVFPLQVAAMIWNDCAPIAPQNQTEDESTVILDTLRRQRALWRPTRLDSIVSRILKSPIYRIIQLLCALIYTLEQLMFFAWYRLFDRGHRNRTPVRVQGQHRQIIGHTFLVSDVQLRKVQEFTMHANADPPQRTREARRVLLRALHVANLLEHGGFTRLHEHAASGYAMSQYFASIGENNLIKDLLSRTSELKVFPALSNGNKLEGGKEIPRQIFWARLIVGSLRGIQNEGRWRGPIAQALFTIAQDNYDAWGVANVSRTAMHRHVYSVSRRWLVDWMMFMWWEIDLPSALVGEVDEFFSRISLLLTSNLMHNTWSLPHAVGELAVSANRTDDVNRMLALLLGPDWELWMEQCLVSSGTSLREAMESDGHWKCVGEELAADISVSSALYRTRVLGEVIATGPDAPLADQARARIAGRIVGTLTRRLREAWEQVGVPLFDPLDTLTPDDEL